MAAGGTSAARNVSAGAVAAIAAWSSYSHMVHVALTFGERPEVAYALPFSVDGMLIVASVVMVDDKRRSHRVRPVARLAFTAGVLASVGANIAAAQPSIGARIVAAWPAVALLLVVEMLARPTTPATAEVPPPAAANIPPAADTTAAAPPSAGRAAEVPVQPIAHGEPSPWSGHVNGRSPSTAHVPPLVGGRAVPVSLVGVAAGGGDGAAGPPLAAGSTTTPPSRRKTAVVPPPGGTTTEVPPPTGRSDAGAAEPAGTLIERNLRMVKPPPTHARSRRPAATTRRLAREIIEKEPHLSRAEVATRLGVSTRRLREVLATPA